MSIDMTAALRAVLNSSIFSVENNHFADEDVFSLLLNDHKVRSFLRKKGDVFLDIHHKDFGIKNSKFVSFEEMKSHFNLVVLPLIEEIEDDIRIVLNHESELRASSNVVVSKVTTTSVMISMLNSVVDGKMLTKSDYLLLTNAGLIRTNFCRWVLIYRFLRPKDQFRVLQGFETWLKEWKYRNLLK